MLKQRKNAVKGIKIPAEKEKEEEKDAEQQWRVGMGMDKMVTRMVLYNLRDAFSKDYCFSLGKPSFTSSRRSSHRHRHRFHQRHWPSNCQTVFVLFRQLAEGGARVVMAVRNPKVAHDLIQNWQSEWSGDLLPLNIEVMQVDLLSLDSVARFAKAWNARSEPLHALINNAGICSIGEPQRFSKDGYEQHMQVNHLAPAMLSILLLPSLIRGSPSRIVNLNSIAHYLEYVDPEDMHFVSGKRKYSSLRGYSSSKLAEVMFSSVLHKRLPVEAGVNVVCVSPGIVHTNVARDLPKILQTVYRLIPYFMFTPKEGSRSALFAATDPQISEYCELLKADEWPVCAFISQDCRPTNPSEEAHNVQTSQKVWEKTLEMIGLPSDAVERLLEGEEVICRYGDLDDE